mgnify:CR=1 FL=1
MYANRDLIKFKDLVSLLELISKTQFYYPYDWLLTKVVCEHVYALHIILECIDARALES